jgi:hypothetical protein
MDINEAGCTESSRTCTLTEPNRLDDPATGDRCGTERWICSSGDSK